MSNTFTYDCVTPVKMKNFKRRLKSLQKVYYSNNHNKNLNELFTNYAKADFAFNSVQIEEDDLNSKKLEKMFGHLRIEKLFDSETKEFNVQNIYENTGQILEHRCVKAHSEAQEYLFDLIKENKNFYLDEKHFKIAHQILMKNNPDSVKLGAGFFRNEVSKMRGDLCEVILPKAQFIVERSSEVPIAINELIYKYNHVWNEKDPIEKAALLHTEVIRIHPFLDGNGRIARMMANMVLLGENYPNFTIRQEDKADYYKSINQTIVFKSSHPATCFLKRRCEASLNFYNELLNKVYKNDEEQDQGPQI